jgi:cytochrome c
MLAIFAAAAALGPGAALAQSGPEVLKARGCLTCHDAQTKKIGPAFKDIALKHQGSKSAEADLMAKLREGKGHPKVAAPDAELKAAIQHVLATK